MDAAALTLPAPLPPASGAAGPRRSPFLSTQPADEGERRLAFVVVAVSLLIFAAAAPFAKRPLAQVPAFLPLYQSALVVSDFITAVLLFGQFRILRWNALLLLAAAYLFSALMAIAHGLSFPGLFAPTGLFGSGGQTTAWIYFLWHASFPLLVIGYTALANRGSGQSGGSGLLAPLLLAAGAALAAAVVLSSLAIAGLGDLPPLMQGDRDAPAKVYVATAAWATALFALPALWRRRPLTVLDLWLMVVMLAWIFDVALAAVLNAGRYDLGWYVGRVYGFLAASFVLVVLLLENGRLYAELAQAREAEARRAEEAQAHHGERLRIMHEIDRAIVAREAPGTIAGAIIQPLRALLGVPRAIVNTFDLDKGEVEWLAAAGRHRTHVGGGVRYSIRMMGDVEALRRGEPQVLDTGALPDGPEVQALLASGVRYYMVMPMISGGELLGALSFGGERPEFAPAQVAVAREIATQLAIVMSQARLVARIQQHADELEERVSERTAELQAANRELESFSYSVSHDLRAPLRGVVGFAGALMEDHGPELSGEGRRKLGIVMDEGRRMGVLIDELLAFSRLGRKALQLTAVDMTELARGCLESLQAQHQGAPPEVWLGALPAARGDRVLLGQVWINLLSNALKFSAKRERPRIEIGAETRGRECTYRVADNGAGFDARYQSKLFGVFQRLHDASEFPGTGVGLALVQRIVNRHGGRIWAESRPGEGATFYFALPVEEADGAV